MAALVVGDAFEHAALLYRGDDEYLAEVSAFVWAALARGDPVLVAVPGFRADGLREVLAADSGRMMFTDMAEAGRNPGRIISAVRTFADSHPGKPVSAVGEPVWPARSVAESVEAARHEALSNLAFATTPMRALCPYDAAALPAQVLAAAEQTHPLLAQPGGPRPSPAFLGSGQMPSPCLEPLASPPPDAQTLRYTTDLRPARDLVNQCCVLAGMPVERAADLVIAVGELAANTLAHTPGGGTLSVWQLAGELICEITDQGEIKDPLAGRLHPAGDEPGGYGLWVVHQVCDLVETRTGPDGTTTRCHMSLHR